MLRGNLSTRPFYNERAAQALLLGLALALAALSVFTTWSFLSLTSEQRVLWQRIAADEARAASLRREAERVRGRIDPKVLASTVEATREANAVIDERTFSWTGLFNVIERTIPADIRLRSVSPSTDRGTLVVRIVVNARRVEPVGVFMDRLEAAGAFADLQSVEEQAVEDGTINVVCEGRYLGPGTPATAASSPVPAGAGPSRSDRGRGGP